ncbi:MAG: small multi-drug export protein [Candidatus Omnitrophica bacterium]|nr:small multi-drug export protein [Candidatus Omnitrophota bacterium]
MVIKMLNLVLNWLKGSSQEYIVLMVSSLPIFELRIGIPLGLYFGMPLFKVFWLALLGNIIPVMPLLCLLEPVSIRLRRFKPWRHFFNWLFARTKNKSELIQKYEALGLAIFVAIPLPMTGAWTGAVAASLFKIRFRYAFLAIILGVFIAGLIVSGLSYLGIISYKALIK